LAQKESDVKPSNKVLWRQTFFGDDTVYIKVSGVKLPLDPAKVTVAIWTREFGNGLKRP